MEQNCSRNSFPIARKSFARTGHKLLANQQRIFGNDKQEQATAENRQRQRPIQGSFAALRMTRVFG
jgi:hypothetical protein